MLFPLLDFRINVNFPQQSRVGVDRELRVGKRLARYAFHI